jgi:hypothetical protein
MGQLVTMYVSHQQRRNLIEEETPQVHSSQPLFQVSCAVCDYANHLLHESLIRRYLAVPTVHEFLDDDGDDGVKLEINIVAASEWR